LYYHFPLEAYAEDFKVYKSNEDREFEEITALE
jgi:hypothetical protein